MQHTGEGRRDFQHLTPGNALVTASLAFTWEEIEEYLAAVEDPQTLYWERQVAPPMFLATRAIRALLAHLSLPPGSVHMAQEVESVAPCRFGTALTLESQISQNAARGPLRFLGVAFEIHDHQGTAILRGKSTVLVPVSAATPT
jgi:acyl dehydratase